MALKFFCEDQRNRLVVPASNIDGDRGVETYLSPFVLHMHNDRFHEPL